MRLAVPAALLATLLLGTMLGARLHVQVEPPPPAAATAPDPKQFSRAFADIATRVQRLAEQLNRTVPQPEKEIR